MFAFHRSDAEQRPSYQQREDEIYLKPQYDISEFMGQENCNDEGNIGAIFHP
jgi:hypothetical protein